MSTSEQRLFPVPGRGAWGLRGGLLPIRPGSTNKAGYYRLARDGERQVGSGDLTNHDTYVVNLGVRAVQRLCGIAEKKVDGIFGPQTEGEVKQLQGELGLKADGVVGPATIKAGITGFVQQVAQDNGLPANILGGLLANESGLDPAAVGVNGSDHGIAQYNLDAHPDVTVEQACDVEWSILEAAEDLASVRARWNTRVAPGVNPLDIAIAWHNSPALAQVWARTGSAPLVTGRVFQIATYVEKVKTAW
jgi:hypothetical protein